MFLRGAGSTFSAALYTQWIDAYHQAHPEILISYEAVGSGEGVRRFVAGSVDFGATDVALSDREAAEVSRGTVMVATSYPLPGENALREQDTGQAAKDRVPGDRAKAAASRSDESKDLLYLPRYRQKMLSSFGTFVLDVPEPVGEIEDTFIKNASSGGDTHIGAGQTRFCPIVFALMRDRSAGTRSKQ
jgi:hypothetical protein